MRAIAGNVSDAERPRDRALLDQCVGGDDGAWRLLCRRHYPHVAATLRKLGIPEADVEDAAQEVFIEVFRYLPRFRGDAELTTWLYRLCISRAHLVRKRARTRERLKRFLSFSPAQAAPEPPGLGDTEARRKIERALSVLSEKQREVFVLYELENVPGKQIAEILRCPEATVWRRLHDARHSFTAAMEDLSRGRQAGT